MREVRLETVRWSTDVVRTSSIQSKGQDVMCDACQRIITGNPAYMVNGKVLCPSCWSGSSVRDVCPLASEGKVNVVREFTELELDMLIKHFYPNLVVLLDPTKSNFRFSLLLDDESGRIPVEMWVNVFVEYNPNFDVWVVDSLLIEQLIHAQSMCEEPLLRQVKDVFRLIHEVDPETLDRILS